MSYVFDCCSMYFGGTPLSGLSAFGGCRNEPGSRRICISISVIRAVGTPWWTLGRGHCGTPPARAAAGHRVLGPQRGLHSPCRSSADLRLVNRLLQIATDDPQQPGHPAQDVGTRQLRRYFPGCLSFRLGGGDKRSTPSPQLRIAPQPAGSPGDRAPSRGDSKD